MDIKAKIDLAWNAHLEQICFKECESIFGTVQKINHS